MSHFIPFWNTWLWSPGFTKDFKDKKHVASLNLWGHAKTAGSLRHGKGKINGHIQNHCNGHS